MQPHTVYGGRIRHDSSNPKNENTILVLSFTGMNRLSVPQLTLAQDHHNSKLDVILNAFTIVCSGGCTLRVCHLHF